MDITNFNRNLAIHITPIMGKIKHPEMHPSLFAMILTPDLSIVLICRTPVIGTIITRPTFSTSTVS